MAPDDESLMWWQHAIALLRHYQAQDADAFAALINDPDVDVPNTVVRLCRMVQLLLTAADLDTDAFIDELASGMISAAADPEAFIARMQED